MQFTSGFKLHAYAAIPLFWLSTSTSGHNVLPMDRGRESARTRRFIGSGYSANSRSAHPLEQLQSSTRSIFKIFRQIRYHTPWARVSAMGARHSKQRCRKAGGLFGQGMWSRLALSIAPTSNHRRSSMLSTLPVRISGSVCENSGIHAAPRRYFHHCRRARQAFYQAVAMKRLERTNIIPVLGITSSPL